MRPSRVMMACAVAVMMACAVAGIVVGRAVMQGSALHPTVPRGSTRAGVGPAVRGDGLIAIVGVTRTLRTDTDAVYTMRPDGSQPRMLPLPAAMLPLMVAVSPDGKQLAFDAGNLFVIGTDGHGLRQLTPNTLNGPGNSFNVGGPETWSPDGQWIAFRAFVLDVQPNQVGAAVFAVRANGTGLHQVLTGFAVTSLAWGPGGLLAFTGTPYPAGPHWPAGRTGIWMVAMNTADARPVPGTTRLLGSWTSGSPPSLVTVDGWSPDGRSLLIYDAPHHGDLSILPAGGGRPRTLLDCPAQTCTTAYYLSSAAWSPDGSTIMFTVDQGVHDSSTRFYTIPVAGGRLTLLHLSLMRVVSGLSWQPPG